MSAYATRAPRQATVYVCPVTFRPHPEQRGAYVYWSGPMYGQKITPVATGEISPRRDGTWSIRTTCLPADRALIVESEQVAKRRICEWLTRMAGAAMQTFSGAQRVAMGQVQCPRLVNGRICGLSPEVGTIWCSWHPGGRDNADA